MSHLPFALVVRRAALLSALTFLLVSPMDGAPLASQAPAGATGASTPAARADKPRGTRLLTVPEAERELELIRPARPRPAPDITARTPDGSTFKLGEHRGKVALINFWATWCAPCLEEMPALERLWQRHKSSGFLLVAVSLDTNTSLVRPFVAQHGLTFPIALDPRMEVANAYGVRALPTTVVLDRQGAMQAVALGPRVWDNDAAHALIDGMKR